MQRNDINPKDRLIFKLIIFFPCLTVFYRKLDNDIWFILNHGRYVLEKGIPHTEPFTIHHDFHFVMQQWLSSAIFWIVYSRLGAIGIKILVVICYAVTVYIIYKLCMKVSENNFFISFIISLVFSLGVSCAMLSRPYVFSTIIFALELYCLESYKSGDKIKYLFILPVLSAFLINMQAAMWPMLFVIVVPYVIESFKFKIGPLANPGAEKKLLFPAIIVMLAAGFLNPYGLEAMTYLFRSYGVKSINDHIIEMQPASLKSPLGIVIFLGIMVVTLVYGKHKTGNNRLRYILLAAGTGYLALSSIRGLSLFAVCAVFPMAYYLKDSELNIKQKTVKKETLRLRKILTALIIVSMPLFMVLSFNLNKTENKYDNLLINTIDYIQKHEDVSKVTLYTGYGAGGMAEFKGIPAYIDARAEVFLKVNNKKSDVLDEYFNLQAGTVYYKDVLDKYHFTHLILDKNDVLNTLLKHDEGYKEQYSNEMFTLYKHIK